jgi:thiol:disulfide interchange protein DsbC
MFTKAIKTPLAIALLTVLSLPVMADEVTKAAVQAKFPATPITDASPVADFPGLIELVVGNQIFYTNSDSSRLLIGHIFDPKTNTDLTQQKIEQLHKEQIAKQQAELERIKKLSVDWSKLPLKEAIVIKKGKAERTMAVVASPDCGFCTKLEQNIEKMDNIAVYVFILGKTPIAEKILCAPDKSKAWQAYMLNKTSPDSHPQATTCNANDALEKFEQVANQYRLYGTPALIAKNGKVNPGYMELSDLESWLNENGKALSTSKPRVWEKK